MSFPIIPRPTPIASPPKITSPLSATPGTQTRGIMMAVIQSVDNANFPQFATVLINNKSPGEMGYQLPPGCGPFAAGGTSGFIYFYNNSQGIGGSIVYVDADARVILTFTGGVSTSAPVPYYKALADHLHNGNFDPDGFQNPQPVNLSNGEIQSLLPYGNSPIQFQGVVGSDGALLATMFPGMTKQIVSGPYAGCFQPIADTIKDPQPIQLSQSSSYLTSDNIFNSWMFLTTYSQASGNYIPSPNPNNVTGGFGPIIWDASGNYIWFQMQLQPQGGIFINVLSSNPGSSGGYGSPDLTADPYMNNFHVITCMVAPLSQNVGQLVYLYFDSQLVTGNMNTGILPAMTFAPPFYFGWMSQNDQVFPYTGIYMREFECGLTMPMEFVSGVTRTNFDVKSNFLTTSTMQTNVMNATPYTTDFTLHYSVSTTTPYVITYWYDNGSGGDAKIYQSSSNQTTSLGHTTSGTPSGTYNTGYTSGGSTSYVMVSNSNSNGLQWTWQNTPFTPSQIQTAYQDSTVALIASVNTGTSGVTVNSGGTGTRTGNGGRTFL